MFSGERGAPVCTGLAVGCDLFGPGLSCLPVYQVAFCSLLSWLQAGHQQEGSRVLEAQLRLPRGLLHPRRSWSEGPFRAQPPEPFRAGLLKGLGFYTELLFSVSGGSLCWHEFPFSWRFEALLTK